MTEAPRTEIRGLPLQFWVVTFIAFINAVGFTVIIPVLYPYAKKFGLTDFEASLLTTVYAASQFLGTPVLGGLSDRFGRKPLLVVSLVGTVLANLLAGLTEVAWLLFAARAFDGLTGGNNSVARAVVSDITTREARTRAFGIFGATFRLGFVAGPPLSFLAQKLPPVPGFSSLGMSFLVAAGVALLATLGCIFLLPETRPPKDYVSSSPLSVEDFPLVRVARAVSRPRFRRTFIVTLATGFTFTLFTFAFQPFFLHVLKQPPERLAIVFAGVGGLGFVTQVTTLDPLQRRLSRVRLLAVALAARGVVFVLLPLFPFLLAFGALMAFFGLVNSFPLPLINAILSLRSNDEEQGEILGINSACLSFANALGPAVSGALVMVDTKAPFLLAGALTLVLAGVALTLDEPREEGEGDEAESAG